MSSPNDDLNIQVTYKDTERVGHRRGVLQTEIEGDNKLSRIQKYIERRQKEGTILNTLEGYYYNVSSYYKRFGQDDLEYLIDLFRSLPFPDYKNPIAFILGYIMKTEEGSPDLMKNLMALVKATGVDIGEVDIIRYYRLIKMKS